MASIYKLPVGDGECDEIVNIFAPACPQEFSRVLKKDGVFVKAIPLEKHLWELKSAVYDAPYENEVPPHDIEASASSVKRRYAILLRSKAGRI